MCIRDSVQSNPANLTKSANKEYIFYRRHDETIAPIGTNITHGCVANVQYINRKFVNMYLCSNGLPIDHAKSADVFKGYGGLTTEFENRDNRMKNCLCLLYTSTVRPMIPWWGWALSVLLIVGIIASIRYYVWNRMRRLLTSPASAISASIENTQQKDRTIEQAEVISRCV